LLFSQLTCFSPLPTAKVEKRRAGPSAVALQNLGEKSLIGPAARVFVKPADLRFVGGEKWPEKPFAIRRIESTSNLVLLQQADLLTPAEKRSSRQPETDASVLQPT
jgi:hypothetical protein